MGKSLLDALGGEVGGFFAPLVDAAEHPDGLPPLLDALGAAPDGAAGAALAATGKAVGDVLHELEQIAAAQTPSFADIAAALDAAQTAMQAVRSLEASGSPATAGLAGLGNDLIDLLTG